MDIQWETIKGFETYEVSTEGQVRRTDTKRILNPFILKTGECEVGLYRYGKRKTKKIHRLVAEAFVHNPNQENFVKHKDGNKQNNHASNLEWVNRRELESYQQAMRKASKTKSKAIQMLDLQGNVLEIYESVKEASYKTRFSELMISRCANGKVKQVYDKKFKFVEVK